jgi:hypothetical protein
MGFFKYEDCPLKHFVRMEGWLPFARRRARLMRASQPDNKEKRGLRYFTFCAVGAIDVLMLDVARIIKKNDGKFDNVVFFDRTDDLIVETQRRIPGAIGFPGAFVPIVVDEDPVGDAEVEARVALDANTNEEDEQPVRERQRKLDIRRTFRGYFPFDVINLDLEEFLFKQRDPFPGQVVKAMKRIFEWQRQALLLPKEKLEHLKGFTLMFTTQIGPPAMHADYLRMLRALLETNVAREPELLDLLEGRAGLRDLGRLETDRFDLFFKLAVPKVIASILLDEDWFIDPTNGVSIFEFDRESKDGPYKLLHMVMDVNRQHPARDDRTPNTQPAEVTTAYHSVVRKIFEVPERVVTREEIDVETVERSLNAIRQRRRVYCPDEREAVG